MGYRYPSGWQLSIGTDHGQSRGLNLSASKASARLAWSPAAWRRAQPLQNLAPGRRSVGLPRGSEHAFGTQLSHERLLRRERVVGQTAPSRGRVDAEQGRRVSPEDV